MTQEALKLALEALEDALNKPMWNRPQMTTAITDIKEALAEHAMQDVQRLGQEIEQEPVAWMNGWGDLFKNPDDAERGQTMQPLYTTPPQRTWVGLMRGVRVDGDTVVITVKGGNDAARELCGKLLKEKNT